MGRREMKHSAQLLTPQVPRPASQVRYHCPMPRPRPETTRDILEVDWPFFGELCRALALHVARAYDPEVIVGVAKAGVIPAAIIATILQRELSTIVIGRPNDGADPQLIAGPPGSLQGRRVLLVDETCDSGDTLKLAVHSVKG